MIRTAEHTWQTAPTEGFGWSSKPEGLPNALLTALEPYSGQQFAGSTDTVTEWSMRTVLAAGVHWQVLSRIEGRPPFSDGRVNRATRHLILEQPSRDSLPGALLYEDEQVPIGGGDGLGHDSMSQIVDQSNNVNWDACGGDWSEAFANRIQAGDPVRAILPACNTAMDWWRAIESAAGPRAWNRNVLLERLPDESGADVVLAVDGTPCATALRNSGRSILDLATDPKAPPPPDRLEVAPGQTVDAADVSVMTTVELKPGGPPVGLAALTILALLLVGGAVAVLVWAMNTGVQS